MMTTPDIEEILRSNEKYITKPSEDIVTEEYARNEMAKKEANGTLTETEIKLFQWYFRTKYKEDIKDTKTIVEVLNEKPKLEEDFEVPF